MYQEDGRKNATKEASIGQLWVTSSQVSIPSGWQDGEDMYRY